jgi:hypothetical protein
MEITIYDYRLCVWTTSPRLVTPGMRETYTRYKEREHYYREMPYSNTDYIVYRPENDPYMPTYIALISDIIQIVMTDDLPVLHNGTVIISREIHNELENNALTIPILDLNDIRVFVSNDSFHSGPVWVPARSYQIWAYRDFMYDPVRSIRKSYMSRGTSPIVYEHDDRILSNQIVTIDIANIAPNIVFNLSRNENGSICLERNDDTNSRMRICDNEYARAGYLGFFTRLMMDPGMSVAPSSESRLSIAHLSALEETNNQETQCILCVRYRVNARFSPCDHQVCCSHCYSQMSKNECPICRATITRLMNV